MLPCIMLLGNGAHFLSVKVVHTEQRYQILAVFVIICAVECRLPVIDHIVCQYGTAEEHRLYQRGICAACAVPVYVPTGMVPQCIEYIKVIDRIQQLYIGTSRKTRFQPFPVMAIFPVADKNQPFVCLGECLQCDMAIVLGFDTADGNGILLFCKSVLCQYLLLPFCRHFPQYMITAVCNQDGILMVGFSTEAVRYVSSAKY